MRSIAFCVLASLWEGAFYFVWREQPPALRVKVFRPFGLLLYKVNSNKKKSTRVGAFCGYRVGVFCHTAHLQVFLRLELFLFCVKFPCLFYIGGEELYKLVACLDRDFRTLVS